MNCLKFFLLLLLISSCGVGTGSEDPAGQLCETVVCDLNQHCIVEGEGSSCICDDGFRLVDNHCEPVPPGCETLNCGEEMVCKVVHENPACICKDGYYQSGDLCVYDCRDIEGATVNGENSGCICKESTHYLNDDEKRCVLKTGCRLDEANCGDHGVCQEDLEGSWFCKCDDGYYFNKSNCVPEQLCNTGEIPCSGAAGGCCEPGAICLNDRECQTVEITGCQSDNECKGDQFCDPVSESCINMDDENGCIFKPEYQEQLTPLIAWEWPGEQTIEAPDYKYVMMAPMVANISDDNGDGVVNLKDTPDVVFSTFKGSNYRGDGIIRVVDGKTGREIATTAALSRVVSGWELALGDINNDGQSEIVGFKDLVGEVQPYPLIAFRYNLETKKMEELWTAPESSGGKAAAIADIDHDGKPEVIAQAHILNGEDGSIHCSFPETISRFPIVEDVNGDQFMDVISGNRIYSGEDCSPLTENSAGGRAGYLAMADLDRDGVVEIVSVAYNTINIYDLLLNPKTEPFVIGDPTRGGGGPPTIANFDKDESDLEIAVAGEDYYSVTKVDFYATDPESKTWFLWKKLTEDHSSKSTGSSLFDFEGDGIAEVLYADQCYFRIYNGEDGSERFKIINSNGTLNEYPIVVDVDNDGKSEVIVGSNNYGNHPECDWYGDGPGQTRRGTNGIRVFESATNSWVRTRRIWNQHTYHVTNVNEDGSIPRYETHNWESYNNYRLNTQGKGVFNAPNFVITRVVITREDCPELKFTLKITLGNKGSLSVPAEIPVAIYRNEANTKVLAGVVKTGRALRPGEETTLIYEYLPVKTDKQFRLSVVADDLGNGSGLYNECLESDNSYETVFKGHYTLFCTAGVGSCMRIAPYICDENNQLSCGATPGEAVDEICGDGFDNNCNGEIDEGCVCDSGSQPCYSGAEDLLVENARCQQGVMHCIGGEIWGRCAGDILPVVELCNGKDDDCDGVADEDFPDLGQSCSLGIGACKQDGFFVCDEDGSMICDATPLEPQIEICGDGIDNNCNGPVDEKPCQEQ